MRTIDVAYQTDVSKKKLWYLYGKHCPLTLPVKRRFKYKIWCFVPIILCHIETKLAVDNICKYFDGRL